MSKDSVKGSLQSQAYTEASSCSYISGAQSNLPQDALPATALGVGDEKAWCPCLHTQMAEAEGY